MSINKIIFHVIAILYLISGVVNDESKTAEDHLMITLGYMFLISILMILINIISSKYLLLVYGFLYGTVIRHTLEAYFNQEFSFSNIYYWISLLGMAIVVGIIDRKYDKELMV